MSQCKFDSWSDRQTRLKLFCVRKLGLALLVLGLVGAGIGALAATAFFDSDTGSRTPFTSGDVVDARSLANLAPATASPTPTPAATPAPKRDSTSTTQAAPAASPTLNPDRDPRKPRVPAGGGVEPEPKDTPVPDELAQQLKECDQEDTEEERDECRHDVEQEWEEEHP